MLAVPGAPGAGGASGPRCFGAASRDPEHPCRNAALRRRVTPAPDDAILQPDPTCAPPPAAGSGDGVCTFGAAQQDATSTMALVGDSHALHWRPALGVVADALRWRAFSLTLPSCPFSTASYDATPKKARDCQRYNAGVVHFLDVHPEVETVVVSEDHEPFTPRPGSSAGQQQMAGFASAWRELPATVKHVIVIRDVTYEPLDTADCVTRARRRRRDAGSRCAVSRRRSLRTDYAVTAARRERAADPASRVVAVDLTPFFCGRRRCFPVVGGVLVHKDPGHLTLLYARTLGPYLLRAMTAILAA